MSQRFAIRGFVVGVLAVLVAVPAAAQITFSPSVLTFGVGETSPLVTAQVVFSPDQSLPGGLHTLVFGYGQIGAASRGVRALELPYGITTIPSTVTFTTAPGQTSATVSFRLVAEPWAFPGFQEVPVYSAPTYSYGLLEFEIEPVSVLPSAVTVVAGTTSGSLEATVGYSYYYPQGPQQLVFSGLPAGAAPTPNPVTFTLGVEQSYAVVGFRITTSASTPPGTYVVGVSVPDPTPPPNFFVEGTVQALQTYSDTFLLTVQAPGRIGLTAEKGSVDACPGGAAVPNSVLVESLDGYRGAPTLTFPLLPSDIKVTPGSVRVEAIPPSRTAAFEVSVLPGAFPGRRVVTVLASDPDGPSGSTSFVVNVGAADFAPSAAPAAVTLTSGGAGATITASLAPNACAPPPSITVTPTGLPAGVTATPASAELVGPSFEPVVFTLSASSIAPAGTAEAAFVFQPPAGDPRTATVAVSVLRVGQIGVDLERPVVDLCPGGAAGTNSLAISSLNGYAGAPTVTFPDLPAGLTVSPETIPVDPVPPSRVVVFTVRAEGALAPGPAVVTARVDDPRGFGTTVSFVANVLPPSFTPTAAPAQLPLNAGGAPALLSVSLVPGSCPPVSDVTVTPSDLPPGVTVEPPSVVLAAPGFGPAEFSVRASEPAAPGVSTILFSFGTGSGFSQTASAEVLVCGPPDGPESPVIQPQGNPSGPVTATDGLALRWEAPLAGAVPSRYEWRLNGSDWTTALGTSASAPPRGTLDPVQLFVRGYACDPERGPGAEAASPVYPLAPPVASFAVPASVVAGQPATFTDTSSPQATSWLWFPGDGMPAVTVQSPTVTFPSPGPKVVVLVATNGSGSSSKAATVNVLPAFAVRSSAGVAVRALGREPDGRLALGRVEVEAGTTLLLRRLEGDGEAVAYLRFVDPEGRVAVERRIVLAAGEEARHDLSAWGVTGAFRIELVGPAGLDAAVEERAIPFGEPAQPVAPRRPRGAGTS